MRPQRQLAATDRSPARAAAVSAAASSASSPPRPQAAAAPPPAPGSPAAAPRACSGNTVRRLSCRSTRSLSAPSSAAAVERARQPHRQRDHIGRAGWPRRRLQPLQEPQPPLRIGQRDLRRTRPPPPARARAAPRRRRQPQRQRRHARRLEQAADRNLDIQRRTDPADQPRRQQRVPAQLEEVVVDADPLDAPAPRQTARTGSPPAGCAAPAAHAPAASSGAGSARRSSLPFGVSGSRSSTTIADGTM